MTAPVVPASETVRQARSSVASDIARSRRRIQDLSAQLRAETQQLANLTAIAEIVGVTAVEAEDTSVVVVDPSVSASVASGGDGAMVLSISQGHHLRTSHKTEAPPAVGTPVGP